MGLMLSYSRKMSDGLFLRECESVSKLYPGIEFRSMIIDNCCMQVRSHTTHHVCHVHCVS